MYILIQIINAFGYSNINQYKIYNNGIGYSDEDYNIRCSTIGEKNTSLLPFRTNNRDVILFHNENADGSGPFGRHYENTPIKAQIIHLANNVHILFLRMIL